MKLVFFGPSCVGKSTLARMLSDDFGVPYRSCGELVKEAALLLGCSIEQLPKDVHDQIDGETKSWVCEESSCIVEGRFLDQVLSGQCPDLIFILVDATLEERLHRWENKSGRRRTSGDLKAIDQEDERFRIKVYDCAAVIPDITIDTSNSSPEACKEWLKQRVTNQPRRPHD